MITNNELKLQTFPALRIDPRLLLLGIKHQGGAQSSLKQAELVSTTTVPALDVTDAKVIDWCVICSSFFSRVMCLLYLCLNHQGGAQLSLKQSVPGSTPTGTAPGATASKVTGWCVICLLFFDVSSLHSAFDTGLTSEPFLTTLERHQQQGMCQGFVLNSQTT